MGLAAAPARLPGGDEGSRPGLDPGRAAGQLRHRAAEAPAVPRAEGGVLPRRLRARRGRARRLGDRSGADARGAAAAARRVALPPAFEPALPADAAAPRAA